MSDCADLHTRALELRTDLLNALAVEDAPELAGPGYDRGEAVRATERADAALTRYLVENRNQLARTDFWRGHYESMDQELSRARPVIEQPDRPQIPDAPTF